jgi:H/ACA ribonucleoprotein complex non-core subunit NAF1
MSSLFALQQSYDISDEGSDLEMEVGTNLKVNKDPAEDRVQIEVERLMNILLNKVDHHIRFNDRRTAGRTAHSDDSEDELRFTDSGEEDEEEEEDDGESELQKGKPPKTKGELTLDDLPPVEHLHISMPVTQLQQIGRVFAIVPPLVVIQAFRNTAPLNLDSVLFYRDGSAIGSIFDVFGSVLEPSYTIRFNSNAEIASRGIAVNMPVYFVPQSAASITEYVFVSELRKIKGTDASWLDNNEPPEHVKEYSDDEEERRGNMKSKAKRRHNATHSNVPNQSNQNNHQQNYFSRPQHFSRQRGGRFNSNHSNQSWSKSSNAPPNTPNPM